MKNQIISKRLATKKAREYFGVQRFHGTVSKMGGNNPYWLFIHKKIGDSFETR